MLRRSMWTVLMLSVVISVGACGDDGGSGDTAADEGSTETSTDSGTDTTGTTDTTDTTGTTDTAGTTGTETTGGNGNEGDPCNPLLGECMAGLGCYPVPVDMFQCGPEGSGGKGDKCNNTEDCADGLYCAASISVLDCKGPNCCTSFCDLTGDDCDSGEHCAPFFPQDEAPPGLENVGICVAN